MPNNDDSVSNLLQKRDEEAFKLYKHYKTQAKTNPSSELYINIGNCCIKSSMLDHALKYYNKARYLEINNSEKQALIIQKIQALQIIQFKLYIHFNLENHPYFLEHKLDIEKCAANYSDILKISSSSFLEKYNLLEEHRKLLSQEPTYQNYLKIAHDYMELREYQNAVPHYNNAESSIERNTPGHDTILKEIFTKKTTALTKAYDIMKSIISLEEKQMEALKQYEESDLKAVTLAGQEYSSDEDIV